MRRPPNNRCARTESASVAFTLIEVMVGLAVLMVLVIALLGITGSAQGISSAARGRIDSAQMARAFFVQLESELTATVSANPHFAGIRSYEIPVAEWRFVQNPSALQDIVLPGTDSLFWQTAVANTPLGDISNIGYFVNEDRELVRFLATPDIESRFPSLGPDEAYGLKRAVTARPGAPDDSNWWQWLNPSGTDTTFQPRVDGQPSKVSSVIGTGVAGVWFRCFDVEGKPIPVRQVAPSNTGMRYDSGFSKTLQRLPGFVECTIAIFEPATLTRFGDKITKTFPAQQAVGDQNTDGQILESVDNLIESCISNGLPPPRIYRAAFKIPPGNFRP